MGGVFMIFKLDADDLKTIGRVVTAALIPLHLEIRKMNAIVDTISKQVADLETAVTNQGATIDTAVTELGQLKSLLDAAITNSTSPADAAALQSASDKLTAITASMTAKTQALSDAEATNAPSN